VRHAISAVLMKTYMHTFGVEIELLGCACIENCPSGLTSGNPFNNMT